MFKALTLAVATAVSSPPTPAHPVKVEVVVISSMAKPRPFDVTTVGQVTFSDVMNTAQHNGAQFSQQLFFTGDDTSRTIALTSDVGFTTDTQLQLIYDPFSANQVYCVFPGNKVVSVPLLPDETAAVLKTRLRCAFQDYPELGQAPSNLILYEGDKVLADDQKVSELKFIGVGGAISKDFDTEKYKKLIHDFKSFYNDVEKAFALRDDTTADEHVRMIKAFTLMLPHVVRTLPSVQKDIQKLPVLYQIFMSKKEKEARELFDSLVKTIQGDEAVKYSLAQAFFNNGVYFQIQSSLQNAKTMDEIEQELTMVDKLQDTLQGPTQPVSFDQRCTYLRKLAFAQLQTFNKPAADQQATKEQVRYEQLAGELAKKGITSAPTPADDPTYSKPLEEMKLMGKIAVIVAAIYACHRFYRSELGAKIWYDVLKRYKKLYVREAVSELMALRDKYDALQLKEPSRGLEYPEEVHKIYRRYSPADQKILEKAFEAKVAQRKAKIDVLAPRQDPALLVSTEGIQK